jgi:hypothetical protein
LAIIDTDNDSVFQVVNVGLNPIDVEIIGDKIYTNEGLKSIVNIKKDINEVVYDILEVENDHCFYVKCKEISVLLHQCLYIDELGFLANAAEFYESVYPTISSSDKTKVIITSTPKGMNFFYKMWVESEEGRSEYVAYKVLWQEHPDRDQNWYDTMKANLNAKSLEQEVNCVAGDTLVNINGNNVTIESLYNKFNKTNNSSNSVVYFNDIKIET